MKKYFPILLSKKGEIGALQTLTQSVKDDISPIIQVLRESIEKKVEDKKTKTVTFVYKEDLVKFLKTHWSFFNNQIFLDFSLFENIDSKIDEISKLIRGLVLSGVNVFPCIQSNSDVKYREMIKILINEHRLSICIRISDETGGIDALKQNVESIINELEIPPSRAVPLLDLGYIKNGMINSLTITSKAAIKSLSTKIPNWQSFIIAGGSFPSDLSPFDIATNPNMQERFEWTVFNNIKSDKDLSGVKYGDYGTKYPFLTDAKFAPTISIKYTVEKFFVVYKGKKSEDHDNGHRQYIDHAKKITQSTYYSGKKYSWGDDKIFEIAQGDSNAEESKTGNSTTWVQISQNHHITLMNNLL